MEAFLNWFYEFMSTMLDGIVTIFLGIYTGIVKLFNFPLYFKIFKEHKNTFSMLDWIVSILTIIVVIAIWALIIYLIYLSIKRVLKIRRMRINQEDVYAEIADLHKEIQKLTQEKDAILSLSLSKKNVEAKDLAIAMSQLPVYSQAENKQGELAQASEIVLSDESRFFRLIQVDEKYENYIAPVFDKQYSLADICDLLRNFACSKMNLYYDIKILRITLAGMASTKMLLLQGISGTGKTSLPYCMGKFFTNDATIASVQPSWRDRTELFGYFNEFTKKFNETEVLKRIYESGYNDDMNIIVLDEMNIARVEYYFAEMLSILEMPDHNEWKLDLVTTTWQTDPKMLKDGKLKIPDNLWYIGTANNDDSTFAVSDKVYDRALTINLDAKGEPFEAPDTDAQPIPYTYIEKLFEQAKEDYPVSQENLDKIQKLDIFIIQKFRIAFGNRILKQLKEFVPVYVACGGTELDGIDYVLATKVIRKFESLNLSLVRDEMKELSAYLSKHFGKNEMQECKSYLERLARMY